jgi:GAF domain-containing protein
MSGLIERDPRLRLLADLEGLWRLSQAVSRARSVDEIAPQALDALDRTVAPDRSAVLLFDADGVMRFQAWRGLSDAYRAAVDGHSPWTRDSADASPIAIEDPANDPDLASFWPTIEAEGIRSLAFVPLVTRGRVLGKFMLYYDAAHRFADDEILVAEAIAAHIAFAIDRREGEVELERSRQLLDVITRGLADGITVQDRTGALVYANDAAAHMSELDSADDMLATPVAEIFARFEMLQEDGSPFPVELLPGRRVLTGERSAAATMRIRDRVTGRSAWRSVKAGSVLDDDGHVAFAVNIMEDLTAQKQLEHDLRFQKTLLELQTEASLDGILVVSPDGRIVSHNRRFTEMWEMPPSVLGWPDEDRIAFIRERIVDDDGSFAHRVEWLYAHPTEEAHDELTLRDGRVIDRYTAPIADPDGATLGRAWFFRDVTERRRAENEQRFLADASEILASSLDHERTLRQVAEIAVRGVADWCTVHLVDGEETRRLEVAHRDAALQDRVRESLVRHPPDPTKRNVVLDAIREGRAILIEEVTDAMVAGSAPDELVALLRELGLASIVAVPLRARGTTFGAITFISSSRARPFSERDVPLFEEIARRASIAIDNARMYERERTTATILQESLLPPHLPDVPGLEIASLYVPFGDGAVVGGDLYDVFQVGERRWLAMIGDVCGHGPRAAAIGSSVRHAVRVAAMREPTPSSVLDVVNHVLLDRADDAEFCTACVVTLDIDGDGFRLVSSSAGHPLPVVIRADGSIGAVGEHGTLLGVFDDATHRDTHERLAIGDTLLLFTDGLEERRCGDAFFGASELDVILRASVGASAVRTVENLRVALHDFGTESFADDVAILALRVGLPAS